ncbi:hypothetical protein FRACYDRAFT_248101 [Fragilariopsis cylindrus CCMP1102]|uniref:Transmembrane protein n=1 Tax=Fragilariopsis cylindrus CCMP1102 TaxID=635003 RepID=A0A1E7EV47_9STRA|nr:hypothetical protein FRACYDRAFT_248101 [Fragilariopsis cylindrus CCMP1102]|eukprot:OEU09851.1 hypothetical protein FRACYDRAFT_248101 [Fragilariopsis cylindrus CCMP1102]
MSMKKVLSFAFIGLCAICHCGIDCFTMPQSFRATRNSMYHVNTGTDLRIIQGTPSSIIKHHLTTSGSSDSDSDDDNDDDSSSDSDSSTSTSSSDIIWLSAIGLICYCLVMVMVGVGVEVEVGLYFDQHQHLPTGMSRFIQEIELRTLYYSYAIAFFNCITFVRCIAMVKDSMSDKNPQKKQDRNTKEVWLEAIGLACSCWILVGVGVSVGLYFDQYHLTTGMSLQNQEVELRTLYTNYATAVDNLATAFDNLEIAVDNLAGCIAAVIMVNTLWDAIVKYSMSDKTD